jgi:hypothetical protein
MHPDRRPSDDIVIRTGTEHMTIVEAHPYHQPVGRTDHKGAGVYVRAYTGQCPLCRMERSWQRHNEGDQ